MDQDSDQARDSEWKLTHTAAVDSDRRFSIKGLTKRLKQKQGDTRGAHDDYSAVLSPPLFQITVGIPGNKALNPLARILHRFSVFSICPDNKSYALRSETDRTIWVGFSTLEDTAGRASIFYPVPGPAPLAS